MNWKFIALVVALLSSFIGIPAASGKSGAVTVENLKCEFRATPLGIDVLKPRLSWTLASAARGQVQSAYQILVASNERDIDKADLWDSGKVASGDSLHVIYGGKPLRWGQRVFWKVRVWDGEGMPTKYSATSWWEMGLISQNDWFASWIQKKQAPSASDPFNDHPAPLFRKEVFLPKQVSRARAYVSGLGYYELRVNGERVGDHVLDPGWTSYSKRVLYSTYDITKHLRRGNNAFGLMLGNGWFNPLPLKMWGKINPREHLTVGEPRVILQLLIEFTDGTKQILGTDQNWKTSNGPILRNSVFLGEVYDARKELPGWDKPDFDESGWENAVVATSKLGPLRAQDAPPIRVTKKLKPVKVTEPQPNVFIFDFGQNFAGVARLRVKGPEGTRVRLRSGELLYPDGTLNGMTAVCGQLKAGGKDYVYDGVGQPKTAFQLDEYILRGDGMEEFTPRFTFHGFRYVEVTGYPGRPTLDTLEGLRLNTDVESVGSFSCSNEMFNRIQEVVLWTQLANMFSVQSDCPHREKFGYGGDLVAASEMGILNFDMSRFYAKVVHDFGDDIRPNGGFTETAPFVGIADKGLGEQSGPIGWGTAHPLLQWQLYQYYGDRRLLEEQFDNTKLWINLLNSKATNYILENGISDHESLVPKSPALTGTAFYYLNVKLFSQIARVLGRNTEAASADELAMRIKNAFNSRFMSRVTGKYDIGTQACQAFALYFGMPPEIVDENALKFLVDDIRENHKGHLSTGIFGTKYMLHALANAGRADVAYEIVNQRTFPGWGHMLENGATTLWEHWEFSDNTFSHNHPMFGSVSEWFYKVLAGINPAPDAVGFDRMILQPHPVGDLKWVKARYNSVRGPVLCAWEKRGEEFIYNVTIPANTTAVVHMPASDFARVRVNGVLAATAPGVKFLAPGKGTALFEIGSGTYSFASK